MKEAKKKTKSEGEAVAMAEEIVKKMMMPECPTCVNGKCKF